MANVTILNNGKLLDSASFSDNVIAALGNNTYAQRLGDTFVALTNFDASATADYQSGGFQSSSKSGSTTTVTLDRYKVEMTGTLSATGSTLSSYRVTDLSNGDSSVFVGTLKYNSYPMIQGINLLPGSKLTAFGVTSGNSIAWANGNVTLQNDYATYAGTLSSATGGTLIGVDSSGQSIFYGGQNNNSISFTYNGSTKASTFSGSVTSQSIGAATTSLKQVMTSGTFTPTDYITVSGISQSVNSSDTSNLFNGDDTVVMSGNTGSKFSTGSGNDKITGSSKNDVIDGGDGTDTVVFKGSSSKVKFTYDSGSNTFNFTSSVDGNDQITGVENYQFSDKTLTATQLINSVTSTTAATSVSATVNTVAALGTSQVLVASVVTDGLYKANTKQAQYAVSDNSLSVGDSLDGAVILKSSNGKLFTPKGVLAVIDEGDKTGLVTKTKTGWQEQLFGSDGVAEKALVSFNTTQLFAKESSISKDINKDGHVGNFITNIFDPDGLYKSASGAITYTRGGLSIGDVLSGEHDIQISAGKNWTTKSQIVGFVEHDGMGEILMKSGKKYSAQVFHTDTGLIQGGITSVSAANVLARESYYGADLNLDSLISPIGQQAMPTDWTQKNGSWF